MSRRKTFLTLLSVAAAVVPTGGVLADARIDIGLTALLSKDPSLTGAGVLVGQVEAPNTQGGTDFKVDPDASGVAQPAAKFIYHPATGSFSGHANTVASNWYGTASGISPGVAQIDVYSADNFIGTGGVLESNTSIVAKVVNQSYATLGSDAQLDKDYDGYANRNKVLFINATAKGLGGGTDGIDSPASSYNGISVGPAGGLTSGPTTDSRSKPDLIGPSTNFGNGEASYTAGIVSGAASILVQAGLRGDGGANTAAATNNRTLKALLLNGAVKPAGWTHTSSAPLDTRYGAGVVNVNNSYNQLAGGQHAATTVTPETSGGPHPPPLGVVGNQPSLIGWDNSTIGTMPTADAVRHYFFNLPSGADITSYTLTSTLVWERLDGMNSINNLDLYLYRDGETTPVDSSVSMIDNVEHLLKQGLTAGRYDLEVVMRGSGEVSTTDTYGLAFNFVAIPEPSSLGLLAFAAGAMLRRRARHVR